MIFPAEIIGGVMLNVDRKVSSKFFILAIFPISAYSFTIDNDIPLGTLGHWSVDVFTGGQSRFARITAERDASNDIYTEDVLFDYYSYIDIGQPGSAIQLNGTPAAQDPADSDSVSSTGSFIGENGNTVNWKVTSSIPDNEALMVNKFFFSTDDDGPLGRIRLLQYMDEDIESVSDDVFFTKGTLGGRNLELFTVDNLEVYGVSHSGAFDIVSGLENSTFVGWAADIYNQMKPKISGSGQPLSPEGVIDNLPTFNHSTLGTVFGPRDIVSVLAWDVDKDANSATVVTTLGGLPNIGSIFEPPELPQPELRDVFTCSGRIIDPDLPTIVLTHGLQSEGSVPNELWTGFNEQQAGGLLCDIFGDNSANIVQFVWDEANQGLLGNSYIDARVNVYDAAEALTQILLFRLGFNYSNEIHFIGHSLGTVVNAYAARLFLNRASQIQQAQVTIIDYPNHVEKIPGINPTEEDIYGFDNDFFASVLPITRSDLHLRVDNYYSLTGSGVGDVADGPIYNHHADFDGDDTDGLEDPNDVADEIGLDGEGIENDHSGTHQWYRWTIDPNGFNGNTYCLNDGSFDRPIFLPLLDESVNPCRKGWYWSLLNPANLTKPFPRNNGDPVIISTSDLLDIENFLDFGCEQVADLNIRCVEASSPYGVGDVYIPEGTRYISFEYMFINGGDGDYVALFIDNIPIWVLLGMNVVQEGVFTDSGAVPVFGLTGNRKMTFSLYGVGEPNADFMIRNIKALQVQEAINAEIDIFPGSDDNPINLSRKGVIPVAILTTETLNVLDIDLSSIEFGPLGAREIHKNSHFEDINYDGMVDLVLHFEVEEAGILCGSAFTSLTGMTFDGQPIEGSDIIRTLRCR